MDFTKEVLAAMKSRCAHIEANRHSMVIDADTHLTNLSDMSEAAKVALNATPNYYHGRPIGAEDILREMKMAGVDMALTWQNPAATPYSGDRNIDFDNLMRANRYILKASQTFPHSFIPAAWTDPKALGVENALRVVDICHFEFGFPVIKMNPAQNPVLII